MPRNGSGSYSLPTNSWFPAVNGVTATSTDWNNTAQDLQAAMTQSVSSDGQTSMTGNLPMGNNKITGLANGAANGDAVNVAQLNTKADKDIPAARARRTTDDLGIASGIGRTVIFNSADFNFGSAYNTTNGRFSPTVAGVYMITATVYIRSSVTNALLSVNVRLEKNGAEVARGLNLQFASSPTDASVDVQTLVEFDGVSDYVTVVVTGVTSSGTFGIIAGSGSTVTHFSGYLVRAA